MECQLNVQKKQAVNAKQMSDVHYAMLFLGLFQSNNMAKSL